MLKNDLFSHKDILSLSRFCTKRVARLHSFPYFSSMLAAICWALMKVVFHLVDSRHGPVDQDIQLMELMARRDPAKHPVTYVVVLTKADKRSSQLRGTLEKINAALEESGCDAATTPVLLTSANSRLGRDHMWRYLRIAADPGFFEQ